MPTDRSSSPPFPWRSLNASWGAPDNNWVTENGPQQQMQPNNWVMLDDDPGERQDSLWIPIDVDKYKSNFRENICETVEEDVEVTRVDWDTIVGNTQETRENNWVAVDQNPQQIQANSNQPPLDNQSGYPSTEQLDEVDEEFFVPHNQNLMAGANAESSSSASTFHNLRQWDGFMTGPTTQLPPPMFQAAPGTVDPRGTFPPMFYQPSYPSNEYMPLDYEPATAQPLPTPDEPATAQPLPTPDQPAPTAQPIVPGSPITISDDEGTSRSDGEPAVMTHQIVLGSPVTISDDEGTSRSDGESPDRKRARRSARKQPRKLPDPKWRCLFKCVDRSRMPLEFDLPELLERHVIAYHPDVERHPCWVPGCKAYAFKWKACLDIHLRMHGKNKKKTGVRYIATLDKGSGFHDPEYRGPFCERGYPLRLRRAASETGAEDCDTEIDESTLSEDEILRRGAVETSSQ